MNSDSIQDRGKALEEAYFKKLEAEALERLKGRTEARKSPVTGEPMEQQTLMGVVVDKCPSSGGIWLDAGELEQILQNATKEESGGIGHFLGRFISDLSGEK